MVVQVMKDFNVGYISDNLERKDFGMKDKTIIIELTHIR